MPVRFDQFEIDKLRTNEFVLEDTDKTSPSNTVREILDISSFNLWEKHAMNSPSEYYFEYSENVHIHVSHQGFGDQPIVFLHGFGDSGSTWDLIRHDMPAERFRMYMLDLKGFGKSSKPRDGKYSITEQARIVLEFCRRYKLEKIVLVGHSYGGGIALLSYVISTSTSKNPIAKLILEDAAAYVQQWPGTIRFLRLPLIGRVNALIPPSIKARIVISEAFYNSKKVSNAIFARYKRDYSWPGVNYSFRQAAKQILPQDYESIVAQYSQIEIPTLILWGEHDEIIPVESGHRLNRNIETSHLKIFEECGHVPHEEYPQDFVKEILRFLKER